MWLQNIASHLFNDGKTKLKASSLNTFSGVCELWDWDRVDRIHHDLFWCRQHHWFSSGVLGKRVGRPTLFIVATALNISALVAMELWHLARKQLIVFFVIPGIWGLADSIWQTQSAGKCGIDSIYRCKKLASQSVSLHTYYMHTYRHKWTCTFT